MSAKLELAKRKMINKLRNAKDKWVAAVKDARTLDEYVRKIAQVTGLPESVVRASTPVKNFAEFQRSAEQYVDIWLNNVIRAIESGKWEANFIRAFKT